MRLRICVASLLLLVAPLTLPAAEKDTTPQWIWTSAAASTKVAPETCYFRKLFTLAAEPESGSIVVTGDNRYELFVNGRRIGAGENWQQADRYNLKGILAPGPNVIAIVAANGDNGPAGLAAELTATLANGDKIAIGTDASWKGMKAGWDGGDAKSPRWKGLKFEDDAWKDAVPLGAFKKAAPWGDKIKTVDAVVAEPVLVFNRKPRPEGAFQLLDGDRVVFLGDTLFERAQTDDYIETRLTSRYPDRNIIFRNLGWSGDTPFGDARAGFGSAADGFRQMKQQVHGLQPTVILIGYGGVSSFEGEAGLPRFLEGYRTLLEMLDETQAQLVILSPIRHENLGPPLPNPADHNRRLALYRDALKQLAADRELPFVDLYDLLGEKSNSVPANPLTSNGIHLTATGYWQAASALEKGLGVADSRDWKLDLRATGVRDSVTAGGARVHKLTKTNTGVKFEALDTMLPAPAPPHKGPRRADEQRVLLVRDMPPGNYVLTIDGEEVARGSNYDWEEGISFSKGPDFRQAEELRQTIVDKNQLYFYRWRPQNETYLFGFRKHEQGNNAREVPLFDPLVAEKESDIARLRVPVSHTYELKKQ
ncbi:MAG TPA: GDSL-type esterase/lipase family protein [Planctomycetaceae bacterium]|nr:GDSL-type esterase/lipase family protein [Planctomycetaceae bacterium]